MTRSEQLVKRAIVSSLVAHVARCPGVFNAPGDSSLRRCQSAASTGYVERTVRRGIRLFARGGLAGHVRGVWVVLIFKSFIWFEVP